MTSNAMNYPVNDPAEESRENEQISYSRDFDNDGEVEAWEHDAAMNYHGEGYDSEPELNAAKYFEHLEESGLTARNQDTETGLLQDLQAQNPELQAKVQAAVGTATD